MQDDKISSDVSEYIDRVFNETFKNNVLLEDERNAFMKKAENINFSEIE